MIEFAHIRTINPCEQCVHFQNCSDLLRRLDESVVWAHVHGLGDNTPTVLVDCEGRYTPPSRHITGKKKANGGQCIAEQSQSSASRRCLSYFSPASSMRKLLRRLNATAFSVAGDTGVLLRQGGPKDESDRSQETPLLKRLRASSGCTGIESEGGTHSSTYTSRGMNATRYMSCEGSLVATLTPTMVFAVASGKSTSATRVPSCESRGSLTSGAYTPLRLTL